MGPRLWSIINKYWALWANYVLPKSLNSSEWAEDTLRSFSIKCLNELRKDESKTNSVKILYHYTNLNSLNLILSNRNFLFSDFRYLNDSLEFEYGLRLTESLLDELKINNKQKFLDTLISFTANPNIRWFNRGTKENVASIKWTVVIMDTKLFERLYESMTQKRS